MATINDTWEDAINALDTPFVLKECVDIFGAGAPHYGHHLRRLSDMGFVIGGATITSLGVLQLFFFAFVSILLAFVSSFF